MSETLEAAASPALQAAREAEGEVSKCLWEKRSFLLEAGAGAGKTYSLVEALKKLLKHSATLKRYNQRIACITYTNKATEIITSRIDGDRIVAVSTIHAFCWSLIRGFQPTLRQYLKTIPEWQTKLAEGVPLGSQIVDYDLGYRRITEEIASLDHDDVLALTARLLPIAKFQSVVASRYPYILVDEYQDTNTALMEAIKTHLLGRKGGPIVGLFGDHWQQIYEQTCGHVSNAALKEIGKKANFRSATSIVAVLNKMRPQLPQQYKDESFVGSARVFHTNSWRGTRRSGAGGHWNGDLPATDAHTYLQKCIEHLTRIGWDVKPDKTKVLLLTNNGVAAEQGYLQLAQAFPYNDLFLDKADDYIAFFVDKLEPAATAYLERRYGAMFDVLGEQAPRLSSQAEKRKWSDAMDKLIELRAIGAIGQVVDHLLATGYPHVPEKILRRESAASDWKDSETESAPEIITRVRELRAVPYEQVIALAKYLDGYTPFSTKHNVKGDEFENVLVVLGRGWNKYNFDQLLQWMASPAAIPPDKKANYERNRNLFYVACSRPTKNLALLFTQVLSPPSLQLLINWFGNEHVFDVGIGTFPHD